MAAEEYGMDKEAQVKFMKQKLTQTKIPTMHDDKEKERALLWKRGLLKDASRRQAINVRRHLLNNEVSQLDKMQEADFENFQKKLFAQSDE